MFNKQFFQDYGFVLLLLFTSLVLRLWQLDQVPPGWRDDELINSLVISQRAVDGDFRVYYEDASGHEALYHVLNGGMLAIFGPSVAGIRWLSVIMGTLTVLFTYVLARRLTMNDVSAALSAAALSVSFWSLMYSRTAIRHISLPLLVLPAFYFFWLLLYGDPQRQRRAAVGTAICLGLSFYTYFASRGVPLILIAFLGYLVIVDRPRLWARGRMVLLMFALTILAAVPLAWTLVQQPESEARIAELAFPVVAAREGNFEPLREHIVRTLNMFHSDGDEEYLYNLRQRPVFGPATAILFWLGVGLASWSVLWRRPLGPAAAFLLLWWMAGIAPAFLSVPPASLSHTILAQSAVYILLAFPVAVVAVERPQIQTSWLHGFVIVVVIAVAVRDLPAYFRDWSTHPSVRFLYRAEIRDAAVYLMAHPDIADAGITGVLAGPWDRLALEASISGRPLPQMRWFQPERVTMISPELSFVGAPGGLDPFDPAAYRQEDDLPGGYALYRSVLSPPALMERVCFQNGLCIGISGTSSDHIALDLWVTVQDGPYLPDIPLVSNPPPQGVYTGPRLLVFAQLLDREGQFLTGDDGLWIDPTTLRVGDIFVQHHRLTPPDGVIPDTIAIGFYDPLTGERIQTLNGLDSMRLPAAALRAGP